MKFSMRFLTCILLIGGFTGCSTFHNHSDPVVSAAMTAPRLTFSSCANSPSCSGVTGIGDGGGSSCEASASRSCCSAMQLASKMRFISAQFDALLTGDLWLKSAQHANCMARRLQKRLGEIPQVKIIHKVEANGVFAKIPRAAIAKLQKRYFFYVWNEKQSVVRWMCSFDTTEQDVKEFTTLVAQTLGR